jgi:hypothetical protein
MVTRPLRDYFVAMEMKRKLDLRFGASFMWERWALAGGTGRKDLAITHQGTFRGIVGACAMSDASRPGRNI